MSYMYCVSFPQEAKKRQLVALTYVANLLFDNHLIFAR